MCIRDRGKTVDFKNTIVIMTSNVGAQKLKSQRKVGFDTNSNLKEAEYEKMKDVVLGELKKMCIRDSLVGCSEVAILHSFQIYHQL